MLLPLDGIQVLDLTRALAGPLCTSLLADLGAEVVKVETIGRGDDARQYPPYDDHGSLYFASVNRGKRSIAVDLRSDEGRELLRRFVAGADVLVENFRPGVLESMGLDAATLADLNPRLVVVSVSGFGRVGPWRDAPGLDQIVQGMSGLMSVTGTTEPTRVGLSIIDVLTGVHAALGVCAALVGRERRSTGARIDTSLLEVAVSSMTFLAQTYLSTNVVPEYQGNRHPSIAPYGLFPTADHPINLAVASERAWRDMCAVLDVPELLDDERFRTSASRMQHREVLESLVIDRLASHGSEHWIAAFHAVSIPCGPVHTVDRVFTDPQVLALDMVATVTDDSGVSRRLLRGPFSVDGESTAITTPPPSRPGAHTDEILVEHGLTADAIERLKSEGVVA